MLDAHYTKLGLAPGVPFAAVRARYIELAKSCHPDKLSSSTNEERLAKEEYFKEVTVAYHCIKNGGDTEDLSKDDFKNIWESFINKTEFWTLLKDLVVKAKAAAATEVNRHHSIDVPVSLEEIHTNKCKKLRLFLSGVKEPVFTNVMCGEYPQTTVLYGAYEIDITFVIREHPVFRLDTLLDQLDLYTEVSVSLVEFLIGVKKEVTYLDGSVIIVDIPPFHPNNTPVFLEGKGLNGKGDMIVSVHLVLPTPQSWSVLEEAQREKIIYALDALSAPPCEKPKTI